jgi:formylmethanofuran dehydrogenase subunit E
MVSKPRGSDAFRVMGKGKMAYVVQKRREAQALRAVLIKRERVRHGLRKMEAAKGMLEAGVVRARIDKVRKSQLAHVAQTLHWLRV